jgi:peptidoglycan/xylan/chitin deacetylase (PgdA/CDA1 family)
LTGKAITVKMLNFYYIKNGKGFVRLRKTSQWLLLFCFFCLFLPACARNNAGPGNTAQPRPVDHDPRALNLQNLGKVRVQNTTRPLGAYLTPADVQTRSMLVNKYNGQVPKQWSETTTGVLRSMSTQNKVIALTFDACGGPNGNGYDADLINYLYTNRIPATLFINSRWIDANYNTFMALAHNNNFEIENHGFSHRPLSVNGKWQQGITGTQNVGEVVDEVLDNARKIEKMTGKRPRFFRSGTGFYDEVAVRVVKDLGFNAVNYNVLGDARTTFHTQQVKNQLLNATPGSIVIFHMNHPEKDTYEGIRAALPELLRRGYRFVKLTNFPLQ